MGKSPSYRKNQMVIEMENKFFISTSSSYADNRTRVLNHSDTFAIFDRYGDITPFGDGVQGIYHKGTRFLSESEFLLNGERPALLSSAIKEENDMLSVDLTNEATPAFEQMNGIAKSALHISRKKLLCNGMMFEMILFMNYSDIPIHFDISLSFHSDFRDIFEVRGITREKRGELFEVKHTPDKQLSISYRGLDKIERTTLVSFNKNPDSWDEEDTAIFKFSLDPKEYSAIEYSVSFGINNSFSPALSFPEARMFRDNEQKEMIALFSDITTSNELFDHWIKRSKQDLISLLARTENGIYPYAGVPWYNTAFGRDGLITALEVLWIAPDIARDVLKFVAFHQAKHFDDWRDAEPGKIFHEIRFGEMVETEEIPFKKYYGSVDSTPLFIMLAGSYYLRTNDIKTIRLIWENILAALNWIDKHSDLDEDSFSEYALKSEKGLLNQGWKDSNDSISNEEGGLANSPIALCEVQGYIYAARQCMALLARELKENELAIEQEKKAESLREKFIKDFWDEQLGMYVLALDGMKQACRVKSSNAGHTLFTGIADEDHAGRLVKELMSEEMNSGWGIRTLSTKERRYNPMSYHNGSVWPHDVAMIAHGFARYGYHHEAMMLTNSLFDAALYHEQLRLPELFCGFIRRMGEGPAAYPVACSPQAWSVGAVFMLIESCLNMEFDSRKKVLMFRKPALPKISHHIRISNLAMDTGTLDFEIRKEGGKVVMEVLRNDSDWKVLIKE